MSSAGLTVVVADTSVVINIIHTDRFAMLRALPGLRFVFPEEVIAEVTRPEQAAVLRGALNDGGFDRCELDPLAASELLIDLGSVLGIGELACLAFAEQHGCLIAADEGGRFPREVRERLGPDRLLTTPDLYLRAIRAAILTVEEADRDKAVLATKRCVMQLGSFRELLNIDRRGTDHAE